MSCEKENVKASFEARKYGLNFAEESVPSYFSRTDFCESNVLYLRQDS
jgi:hypothetical protein